MSEQGIIICGDLIPAMLDGTKGQTRRIVRPQPSRWLADHLDSGFRRMVHFGDGLWGAACTQGDVSACRAEDTIRCPYGQPGDMLYIREALHCEFTTAEGTTPSGTFGVYTATGDIVMKDGKPAAWHDCRKNPDYEFCPPMYMPKWAARIWREIVSVRVERVQEIGCKPEDAIAEGIEKNQYRPGQGYPSYRDYSGEGRMKLTAVGSFKSLWDTLNAKRGFSWESNPLVWRIEWKKETS